MSQFRPLRDLERSRFDERDNGHMTDPRNSRTSTSGVPVLPQLDLTGIGRDCRSSDSSSSASSDDEDYSDDEVDGDDGDDDDDDDDEEQFLDPRNFLSPRRTASIHSPSSSSSLYRGTISLLDAFSPLFNLLGVNATGNIFVDLGHLADVLEDERQFARAIFGFIFDVYDEDGSMEIETEEMEGLLRDIGRATGDVGLQKLSKRTLRRVMNDIDADKNGSIDKLEFTNYMVKWMEFVDTEDYFLDSDEDDDILAPGIGGLGTLEILHDEEEGERGHSARREVVEIFTSSSSEEESSECSSDYDSDSSSTGSHTGSTSHTASATSATVSAADALSPRQDKLTPETPEMSREVFTDDSSTEDSDVSQRSGSGGSRLSPNSYSYASSVVSVGSGQELSSRDETGVDSSVLSDTSSSSGSSGLSFQK